MTHACILLRFKTEYMLRFFFQSFVQAALCCCLITSTNLLAQSDSTQVDSIFYELALPDRTVELNRQLEEISALSLVPTDTTLLCAVQDEGGVLYFLKKEDGNIVNKTSFRFNGDFEGVEIVDSIAYAIKSNGELFILKNYQTDEPLKDSIHTGLKKKDDVEGLGYLPAQHALLIACKGNPTSDKERKVYAFYLDSMQLSKAPIFTIDPIDVECALGKKQTEDEDCFSPSAIAVHPITQEIYMLSAARKRFVILSPEGELVYSEKIQKKIMPQPEGIAFDKEGGMYISSEGKKGKKGQLLYFRPRRLD